MLQEKSQILIDDIVSTFGMESIFTPEDKKQMRKGEWPSGNDLLGMGKKAMFVSRCALGEGHPNVLFNRE